MEQIVKTFTSAAKFYIGLDGDEQIFGASLNWPLEEQQILALQTVSHFLALLTAIWLARYVTLVDITLSLPTVYSIPVGM